MNHPPSDFSLSRLCAYWGYSRQAYYQMLQRQDLAALEEDIILELVRDQRRKLPRIGGRKLFHLIAPILSEMAIKMGRDRLFDLLRCHNMLVIRSKKRAVTTNSCHPFKVYGNLIKDLTINKILQVFVTDITYLSTLNDFVYLALLTDLYSRKISANDSSFGSRVSILCTSLHQ